MGLWIKKIAILSLFILSSMLITQAHADIPTLPFLVTSQHGGTVTYGLSIKILAFMTMITALPALLMTMSAFTRIVIVLAIVRQALGIPNIPGNQILLGLSIILTIFVMGPTIGKINDLAIQPYMQGKINDQQAFSLSSDVLKIFMLKQTRKADLHLFERISHNKFDKDSTSSLLILTPAFITSELKTAFEIGFLIFMPFLIIDLVIASILMSMGMMMLSPMVISLPFKILFFILVDGWTLIITSLITSFRI